jgi:ketosteroid isomerase-like protein
MTTSEDQPGSAVQQYIDAFNKGDAMAMAAMCADPMSILDGMAPHCLAWANSDAGLVQGCIG